MNRPEGTRVNRRLPGSAAKLAGDTLGDVIARVARAHPELTRAWFSRLTSDRVDGGVFRVFAENTDQVRYLEGRCSEAFIEAVQAATGRLIAIAFACHPTAQQLPPACVSSSSRSSDAAFTFENFVVGPSNEFAHAAAQAVLQAPGCTYNPLFFHGPAGTGKSHLLHALAHDMGQAASGLSLFLSAAAWTNELMAHLEDNHLDVFRRGYRSAEVLILDDVHLLARCDQSQDELFHTFNALLGTHRQIVLSSSCSPSELEGLGERLTSRFSCGLVAALDEPGLETRVAILRRHASLRLIEAADDVVRFLAESITGSCHNLLAVLTRVDGLARIAGSPITLDLAREAAASCHQQANNHCDTPGCTTMHGERDAGELNV